MSTQGKRFAEIRKNILGMSQKVLADYLNVAQTTISEIEKDTKQRIDPNMLKVLAEDFDIDISYLLIGKTNKQVSYNNNAIAIPFYNVPVAAGKGEAIQDNPDVSSIYFDKRWLENVLCVNPKGLFLVYAKGDSMDTGNNQTKDIHDGDLLLVDSNNKEGNNKVFVILENKQDLRVKRLFKRLDGSLVISSDNSKYPQEVYSPNEANDTEIEVIGRVVWNGSKETI